MPYFYAMRTLLSGIVFLVLIVASCRKDSFITSNQAYLLTSDTALHFDTVFTSVGSVTQKLKIFNINEQKLRISNLQLMGGASSFFKINVSGSPGTQFTNVDINKGDSLYIFVSVNINPNNQQLPFIIEDSIRIDYNGNTQFVKLDAFGQNAHFLRRTILTQNTTWQNDLPYVLLDTFAVLANTILTIEKGVKIFCHANTPFTVQGSLHVNGTTDSLGRVVFLNDRLDAPYNAETGTWSGIYIMPNSNNNIINGADIRNALYGLTVDSAASVQLNNTRIEHCAAAGLLTNNGKLTATNCLFANSTYNIYCSNGGDYRFANCTLASYSTADLFHQYPGLTLSNESETGNESHSLQAVFQNCIVSGEDGNVTDEVATFQKSSTPFSVFFENTLYKSPAENPAIKYANCLMNLDPGFVLVNQTDKQYNFHLNSTSPCIDKGISNGLSTDLDGFTRNGLPDLGCYEFH